MIRNWPHINVDDVPGSSGWYRSLLGCASSMRPDHPHRRLFDQLVDADGTVLLSLVSWAEHEHPWRAEGGEVGRGLSLEFVLEDFDVAWERARSLGARVEREPHLPEAGYQTRTFTLRDPDGYRVSVLDGERGYPATRMRA